MTRNTRVKEDRQFTMDSKEMDGMLSSFPVRARTPVLFSEVELSVKNADILSSFDNQFSKRNTLNRPFRP